ncbi:MAG: D-aminoacyl-tRNA deacylase [Gammaproteobacteria bacterium]
MIGLLQRVSEAAVQVDGECVASIGPGLMVLVGVERGDGEPQAARLAERLASYRVFADAADRMNLSVADTGGAVLLVPQFTLPADTRKGTRPSFTPAAEPAEGARLFEALLHHLRARIADVQTGRFGAHMRVRLVNDGPVTFWLRVAPGED